MTQAATKSNPYYAALEALAVAVLVPLLPFGLAAVAVYDRTGPAAARDLAGLAFYVALLGLGAVAGMAIWRCRRRGLAIDQGTVITVCACIVYVLIGIALAEAVMSLYRESGSTIWADP